MIIRRALGVYLDAVAEFARMFVKGRLEPAIAHFAPLQPMRRKTVHFIQEVPGSDIGRVRKHLKDCWRCRTQLEDVQATVTGFMRYRDHSLVPNLPAAPQPWKTLKADFDRIEARRATRIDPMAALRTQ